MTNREPETAVSASLQKIKSIKNQQTSFSFFFSFCISLKSQTSDSFVNYFDGHFAYLKTLDFSFNLLGVSVAFELLLPVLLFRSDFQVFLEDRARASCCHCTCPT